MTAEDAYNIYRDAVLYREKGIHPKRAKNFDAIREREDWKYFERFVGLVQRSCGHVDPSRYISALADFYKGRFPAKMLVHPKGLKIYKAAIDTDAADRDAGKVRESVTRSLEFVVKFMKDAGLKTLEEYFSAGAAVVPYMARHMSAGSVSKHFLAIVPRIEEVIRGYSPDIRAEYFSGAGEWLPRARMAVGRDPSLRKLSTSLNRVIEELAK